MAILKSEMFQFWDGRVVIPAYLKILPYRESTYRICSSLAAGKKGGIFQYLGLSIDMPLGGVLFLILMQEMYHLWEK